MAIEICRCCIYYITIRLNYHVSILKNMGVVANGPHPLSDIERTAPFVKSFINHPWVQHANSFPALVLYTKVSIQLVPLVDDFLSL